MKYLQFEWSQLPIISHSIPQILSIFDIIPQQVCIHSALPYHNTHKDLHLYDQSLKGTLS